MPCRDKEGCFKKHLKWMENQKKYAEIGQQELERFLDRLEQRKAKISFDQHFEKLRSIERSISHYDAEEVLHVGWVIERIVKHGMISLLIHGYCKKDKSYRPLHIVCDVVSEDLWVITTAYDPRSMPWKWDETFTKRKCFCK